jgi:hypothetical protein
MPGCSKFVRSLAFMAALMVCVLPAAWGQAGAGAPAAGTFTITGTPGGAQPMVGVASDGSTWQTILWFINVSAPVQNAAVVILENELGGPFNATCTSASGVSSTFCEFAGNSLLADGAERVVITGLTATTPAAPFQIVLLSGGGYAISAIVQHFDAKGNLLSSAAVTDPGLLVPAVTTAYATGIDEEALVDESILLVNPSSDASIIVTLNAYDGEASVGTRAPIASQQIPLLPLGRFSGLLTAVFPTLDFLSYANPGGPNGLLQGFLSATAGAGQSFGFAVLRQDIAPSGSIVSTPWSAFPAIAAPTGPIGHLSVFPQPTACSGDYTGTITGSADVPWSLYVHLGSAKYLVMATGSYVDATGSLGSTTVNWLAPGEFFTLEAQSGGVLAVVTLTPPASCGTAKPD